MDIKDLIGLFLPKELQFYFEVINTEHFPSEQRINIYLDEKNELPEGYSTSEYESKGFHKEITVQDFPLRGNSVYLIIRRRRWRNKTSGQTIERDWNLVAEGTRITQEFAAFLKEFDRFKNRHNK